MRHPESEECKKFLEEEAKQKLDLKKKKNKPPPQPNLFSFFHSKKPLNVFDKERMTEAVADFLVQTNTSIRMIENPAFRMMLFRLNSGFVAPSRQTITQPCP